MSNNGTFVKTSDISEYNIICNLNPFRYRGYYYDVETGLYYLNSRYFDPEIGRFINADDIANLDINNINGLNLYMYCANNPVMNIDENGGNWLTRKWNKIKNWAKGAWNDTKNAFIAIGNFIKDNAANIGMAIGTSLMVIGGIALIASGVGGPLGAALLGAGVGSFLGGIKSSESGGSFVAGWLGGMASGGLTALGVSIGHPFLFGFLGNAAGTLISDSLNGSSMKGFEYWGNLVADSLLSGLVAKGAQIFGNSYNGFNKNGFKNIFIALTVWSEFAFNYIFEQTKFLMIDFVKRL